MSYETVVVRAQGLSISQLIWRRYKRRPPGVLEEILDVNRGISALPVHLPVGTVIKLPIVAADTEQDDEAIALWD